MHAHTLWDQLTKSSGTFLHDPSTIPARYSAMRIVIAATVKPVALFEYEARVLQKQILVAFTRHVDDAQQQERIRIFQGYDDLAAHLWHSHGDQQHDYNELR